MMMHDPIYTKRKLFKITNILPKAMFLSLHITACSEVGVRPQGQPQDSALGCSKKPNSGSLAAGLELLTFSSVTQSLN